MFLFHFHSFHLILDASGVLGHISLTCLITAQLRQELILNSPRMGIGVTQFCHLELSPKTVKGTRRGRTGAGRGVGVARKRRKRCPFGVPSIERSWMEFHGYMLQILIPWWDNSTVCSKRFSRVFSGRSHPCSQQ